MYGVLFFWKQSRAIDLSPAEIRDRLMKGEAVEGLERLPTAEINAKLEAAVAGYMADVDGEVELCQDGADGVVTTTSNEWYYWMDLDGWVENETNKFVDVFASFGVPLYDSEAGVRYAEEDQVTLRAAPRFEPPTDAEKRADRERRSSLMDAAFESPEAERAARRAARERTGCAPVILVAGGLVGLLGGVVF